MRLALLFALAGLAFAEQPVHCPATISAGGEQHSYQRISVLNGKPGGQEYDLAPDASQVRNQRVTQTWYLKDYRDMPLFLRCHYTGTREVRHLDLPSPLATCRQSFNLDKRGNLSGPYEMECR
jgi:hypothetical protein